MTPAVPGPARKHATWWPVAPLLVAGLSLAACRADGPAGSADWCTPDLADSAAEIAFTRASDEGAWARAGTDSIRFVELWRAGGLNENEALAFPLSASVSSHGRLAIADFMLLELAVVDADGTWHERWARPGRGPGELSRPVAAAWSEDGSSVAVLDIENPRVLFVRDGTAARPDLRIPSEVPAQVLAAGSLTWAGVTPTGRALLQPSPSEVIDPDQPELASLRSAVLVAAPGADAFDTLVVRTTPGLGESRFGGSVAPGWPRLTVAVGPRGHLAVGGEDARYRVRLLRPDGVTDRILCRDVPALAFGEREREPPPQADDRSADAFAAALADAPRPDTLAPFGRLFVSREGDLWVQRERPSALRFGESYHGVPGARYDVFDDDGSYLGEVRAPENARLQAALGDTVWAYEIGALDETWVVAYELRWE